MKCVRRTLRDKELRLKDEVKRVSDYEAAVLVGHPALPATEETGKWHYCPKSIWKAAGRP